MKTIEVKYVDGFRDCVAWTGDMYSFEISPSGALVILAAGQPCEAYAPGVWVAVNTDEVDE